MRDEKKQGRWRGVLTASEAQRIAEIEAQAEAVKPLLAERARIVNRACQRVRYDDERRA